MHNYFGKKDYKTEDLLSFLREVKKYVDINKLTVAGGDPLARADIGYLLREIKRMDFHINLDTVGLALIKDVHINRKVTVKKVLPKDIIPYTDVIGIPLDGSLDSIIQLFRKKLLLSDIVAILDVLDAQGAKICVNTVVHKGNINDIPNIYRIISNFQNIKKWQLFQYMPIGPGGYRNRTTYEISDDTFFNAREKLFKYKNDHGMEIQFKSRSQRKNKYLLVDGDGVIWIPKQDGEMNWDNNDVNNERIILGNVNDKYGYEKIINDLALHN